MLYAILHHHHHGVDVDVVVSVSRVPTIDEVVKILDLDFEPQHEESIEIVPVGKYEQLTVIQ